jgi:spore coat protein CotH
MWERSAFLLVLAASLVVAGAAESRKADAAAALFTDAKIHTLRIDLPESSLAALKQGNRDYVRATVSDGDSVLRNVGVRLKGHSSFQPIDKKPSLTLKFNEFVSGQAYYGLTKVALNNSAQDASYVRELVAAQLYRDAGIPACRSTHVRVQLNGRDLGFYVLGEAINKNFLKREFGSAAGNLYEGESRDVDQKLEQENGDDPTQNDLKALVSAARAPVGQRMEKLAGVLDVDQFTSFLAMEMITSGINGYAFMRNNYRIYHHPKTDKLIFLPHGLDATFGSAGLKPPTASLVVKSLWELPEFQKQYYARVGDFASKLWRADALTNQVGAAVAKLVAAAPDRAVATQIEREAKTLRYQIGQQQQFIASELKRLAKE